MIRRLNPDDPVPVATKAGQQGNLLAFDLQVFINCTKRYSIYTFFDDPPGSASIRARVK
tara:strand:+ start:1099 stop:1275 length:177 start_codon:yes stop_codon:yes gene_type:complete